MNGRLLLDTNIIIGIIREDAAISKHLETIQNVFVPSIVLGELYYGALKSKRFQENIKIIVDLSSNFKALPCDSTTARYYGEVKKDLKDKGCPIPENDIWIAAIALQHKLILVSRDKHFQSIYKLKVQNWQH